MDTGRTPAPRAGREHRVNPDRYFHVMGEGWYMYTREALAGPFPDKNQAELHLERMIKGEPKGPGPDDQPPDVWESILRL
jgi:hypothetical protein